MADTSGSCRTPPPGSGWIGSFSAGLVHCDQPGGATSPARAKGPAPHAAVVAEWLGVCVKRCGDVPHYEEIVNESVYPRLRRIARSRLRFGRDALLDTTALVHESYIRFAESRGNDAADSTSLLRYAPRI